MICESRVASFAKIRRWQNLPQAVTERDRTIFGLALDSTRQHIWTILFTTLSYHVSWRYVGRWSVWTLDVNIDPIFMDDERQEPKLEGEYL